MEPFTAGQRWISETEPELGLGILEEVGRHQVRLAFPASGEARIYATASAPIKRVRFVAGDQIRGRDGVPITVESVEERAGLLTYHCGGGAVPEAELADSISFSKPEDRMLGGQTDAGSVFALRYQANVHRCKIRKSPVAGFVGGRIDLIPHQLYIASEVANRYLPRVLLSDEVGLGKTIEACLILHRLNLTGRAQRILILLPESLVHQWFVELLRRFNMWFTIVDEALCESVAGADDERNPFLEEQLVICSTAFLAGNGKWAGMAIAAEWDMLVVDEAHHLEWTPKAASAEYQLVEALTRKSAGLMLLTATPEQLGESGHFARLRLLDPERYPSLKRFKKEQAGYTQVALLSDRLIAGDALSRSDIKLLRELLAERSKAVLDEQIEVIQGGDLAARGELLADLVDRHGTGRVIFRNTREALSGFPERKALPTAVAPRATLSEEALHARLMQEFDLETRPSQPTEPFDYRKGPRIAWLVGLLRELGEAKILLICRSPGKVEALYEALAEEINIKAAVFHEGLTLLQRDRNAAWFAEPDGARILLCSEIGSEGRNFQFAHHLVLFDLPLDPELLEQRIGRLDRIGQTETVKVHLPYLKGSCTELLTRWHHDGLDGVEHSLKGGDAYSMEFGSRVRELGLRYHEGQQAVRDAADRLIADSRAFREDLEARLSKGQDRLIALNSFRAGEADELIEKIRAVDGELELDHFMNAIFDHFGVTVDDLDRRTMRLSPGQLFTDAFPALPAEGAVATFERRVALGREDMQFLTWDHPMVLGAIDLILSSENGNSAMVILEDDAERAPLYLEAIFLLECVAPPALHVDRFLPPTPIRVVVDVQGEDCTEVLPHETVNRLGRDEESFRWREDSSLLQNLVPQLLRTARGIARNAKVDLLKQSMSEAHRHLAGEARRLRDLQSINPSVRDEEIDLAEQFLSDVARHLADAHLRLDAVRLILHQAPSANRPR